MVNSMNILRKLNIITFIFCIIYMFNINLLFADQKVSKIIIEGNLRVDNDTILAYISLSEGSEFSESSPNVILKELYNTGFFKNVEVSNKDKVFIIKVEENPILNLIGFEGNKRFTDEVLSELISLKKNQIFSKRIISDSTDKLLSAYKAEGRFGTKIVPKIV